jgi:hypothetical protein
LARGLSDAFPVLQRLPLAAPSLALAAPAFIFAHSALCSRFPTHKYPLTLFAPIPVAE